MQDRLAEWGQAASGLGSDTPTKVLGLLAGNPFVTAKSISDHLGVARTTSTRAIEVLKGLGILSQVDARQRDRAYCANDLLAILEEPARLLPTE
jgi:Fic family protein